MKDHYHDDMYQPTIIDIRIPRHSSNHHYNVNRVVETLLSCGSPSTDGVHHVLLLVSDKMAIIRFLTFHISKIAHS